MAEQFTNSTRGREGMQFAALDPYIETNIVSSKERVIRGKDYVLWGDENRYPEYLNELYENVPTLRSIINGSADFVAGDDVVASIAPREGGAMNRTGQTAREQVQALALNYYLYGGCALQVLRDAFGRVSELYVIDLRFLRTNKDGSVFFYSEKWGERYLTKDKVSVYPTFIVGAKQPNSILQIKPNSCGVRVYPCPLYMASVKACEIERSIDEYHLNEINNGFAPSTIINFNNGVPTDEVREEIERNINEKFSGSKNAGRIMLSWNDTITNRATIDQFSVNDFGEKYKTLSERSRQEIFTAFRANPNLFGIPTENLGFSEEEYQQSFKLYNRTSVRPVQRLITDAYDKVFGVSGVLSIKPFSLDTEGESIVK